MRESDGSQGKSADHHFQVDRTDSWALYGLESEAVGTLCHELIGTVAHSTSRPRHSLVSFRDPRQLSTSVGDLTC